MEIHFKASIELELQSCIGPSRIYLIPSCKYIQCKAYDEALHEFSECIIVKTGNDSDLIVVTSPPHDEYGFVTPTEFKHHNFQELEDQLQLLASNYPNITRLYYIGSSVEGRKLYVMEISDSPGIHEPGESFLIGAIPMCFT
jgi:hypothetical protein